MIFRYLWAALLIVPYSIILIVGHGAAPLGLILLLGGFDDPSIGWFGWAGIVSALVAPLVSSRLARALVATAAAVFLAASTSALITLYARSTSGGVYGSWLFFVCAALFLLCGWGVAFIPRPEPNNALQRTEAGDGATSDLDV